MSISAFGHVQETMPAHMADTIRRDHGYRYFSRLAEGAGYVRHCEACGLDMYPDVPAAQHVYMLTDKLWAVASIDGEISALCIDCAEEALGCRLPSSAFTRDRMAPPAMLSRTIQDRLNPDTDVEQGGFTLCVVGRRREIAQRLFGAK